MYNNVSKTIDLEENKAQGNAIKDKLANLMEVVERIPTYDEKKHQEQK